MNMQIISIGGIEDAGGHVWFFNPSAHWFGVGEKLVRLVTLMQCFDIFVLFFGFFGGLVWFGFCFSRKMN